jgi:hypothetical protein
MSPIPPFQYSCLVACHSSLTWATVFTGTFALQRQLSFTTYSQDRHERAEFSSSDWTGTPKCDACQPLCSSVALSYVQVGLISSHSYVVIYTRLARDHLPCVAISKPTTTSLYRDRQVQMRNRYPDGKNHVGFLHVK